MGGGGGVHQYNRAQKKKMHMKKTTPKIVFHLFGTGIEHFISNKVSPFKIPSGLADYQLSSLETYICVSTISLSSERKCSLTRGSCSVQCLVNLLPVNGL